MSQRPWWQPGAAPLGYNSMSWGLWAGPAGDTEKENCDPWKFKLGLPHVSFKRVLRLLSGFMWIWGTSPLQPCCLFYACGDQASSPPRQHQPLAPRVSVRVGSMLTGSAGALQHGVLRLCNVNLPICLTTWKQTKCMCPGSCTAVLRFLATKLRPPHQPALPCASASLFKHTSPRSYPLFSPWQFWLFPQLPFSFSPLWCLAALAHPWW